MFNSYVCSPVDMICHLESESFPDLCGLLSPRIQAVQLSISSDAASFLPRQPHFSLSVKSSPDSIFFGHFPAEIHQFRVVKPGPFGEKMLRRRPFTHRGWHHLSLLRRPARLPQAPEGPEGDGGAERRKDGMVILCRFRY